MRPQVIFFSLITVLFMVILFLFDGTGDGGDSVLHYLYAHHVIEHPKNLFNHWAKPLFTLLASSFAYWGFTGIKLFNALCALITAILVSDIVKNFGWKMPLLASSIFLLMPYNLLVIFSGLTEPLFALMISLSISLTIRKKIALAAVVVSFLPFVRSEGLIYLGVFASYLIIDKKWKYLPLLIIGHAVYGISGLIYYDTILWPFTRIPYVGKENYGSGKPSHFIKQLFYVVGFTIYILMWLGVIDKVIRFFKKDRDSKHIHIETWLIYGFSVAFIVAHTLFWWLGLFHSMGLIRVLLGIAPLLAIIAYRGVMLIYDLIPKKQFAMAWVCLVLAFAVIHPVLSKKPIKSLKAFNLNESQNALINLGNKYASADNVYLYANPFVSVAFNVDHFDRSSHSNDWSLVDDPDQQNLLVIWDNWFTPVEAGVTLEALKKNELLQEVDRVTDQEGNATIVVFKRKD